ncbi:hypothetical protein [Streptomyces anulatus]|uniref:hypothetical protein n=1 Tax=Streptomyces anulatus TaxID=1892 RepID=UPI001C254BDE|nr:hypothetical protein [Streptomyces anulatus]
MSTTSAEAAIRTALHEALTSSLVTSNAADDHALAVYSCSLAAHVVLRHDPHAVALVIGEGDSPNWRSARSVVGADGTLRPLTEDENDDLDEDDVVPNLVDGNAAAWRPLCIRSEHRDGEYHLDLAQARDAGIALLTT